ncbi:helix-turn-helix transcriptional regulator, partial [Helicobacter typhlonius]|uniref:helix-turn-helix domain-containing protein n=1 Tax=Helicobacter typhlonius TaxID=76936 RepID=UPI002FE1BA47
MELSLKMKECRENYGWTQFDLSQKSGVSLSTIKKYEAGLVDNFTYGNLKKISSAFNMTPASFIDEDNVRQMSDKCPTISQKNVRQMSDNISKNTEIMPSKGVSLPQSLNDDIVSIPFYEDITASAGSG